MADLRLVLDTNVLVAAQRSSTGASAQLLRAARDRRFIMLASPSLFLEYEAVLTRDEHIVAAGLDRATVLAALTALASLIEPVDIRFLWRPQANDADDDMVLEAAVNGQADAIVTFETGAFVPAISRFSVALMTPQEAWRKVGP